MTRAPARVGVDLGYQFGNRVHAIAHHFGRIAPRRCHQLVADDQQAEVVARHKALDQDVVAELLGDGKRLEQLLFAGDVDGNAFALVAIVGFDHHRQADVLGGGPSVLGIDHRASAGYRHAGCGQQFFGQLFVLRDGLCNRTGHIHLGRLDAALLAAPTEAHHAAFGHAAVGDATGYGRIDDGAGAGAEAYVLVQLA